MTISAAVRSVAVRRPALVKFSSTWLSSREPSQATSKASPGISPNKPQTLRRGNRQSCTSVSASMPCCAASNMAAWRPTRSPGSRKFKDLAAAVGKHFEAERPAGIERVDFRAILARADDLGSRRQHDVVALDLVDRAQLVGGDGLEQAAGP